MLQGKPALSTDDAQAVRQADYALVLAASEQNTIALAALLDTDFTWTNPQGRTRTSAQLLQDLPQISASDTVPHARTGRPRAPFPFVAQ